MFEKSRSSRNGGGVLLFIKEVLNPIIISKPLIANIDITYVALSNNKGIKLTLALIYRPPAQSVQTDREIYEQIAEMSNNQDTVIIGDFNLPITEWGGTLTSHSGQDLYANLQESSLHQFVQAPTRENNILDLVFATRDDLVSDLSVCNEFSNSDHRAITFNINFSSKIINKSSEKVPNYKKANFRKLRSIFETTNWHILENDNNVNESWEFFNSVYSKAVHECIPLTKRRSTSHDKPKWWSNEIADCLAEKKHVHDELKLSHNDDLRNRFTTLRRKAKKLIKQSKKSLELHIAHQSKTNPKEFYGYIRKKKVVTSSIGPLVDENGDYTTNDLQMSNVLNTFFASVFTTEDLSNIPETSPNATNNSSVLNNITVTERNVINCLEKLNSNKSPGPDTISPRVLKEAKHELAKPLTLLFNKSLRTGTVPDKWKLANVTPIHKKGSKSTPSNYRPISLTSVVSKMLETLIREKLVNHLEENNILKDTQHGFRNKRSCLTNLLDFFHDVLNLYDESKAVDIIYLDFQKAFDKVPHKRLLIKLKSHGIKGGVLSWIENWLSDRKQRVVINGEASEWIGVNSGVPQGSVLGPELFLIYINDIDEDLTCTVSKFADDTKIGSTVLSNEQVENMQNNLDKLSAWAQTWQMRFNEDKCKVLHIGSRNEKATYKMNDTQLQVVDKEKDLGVIISNNLKPSQQCAEVVKKANKIIGFIGRSFEHKNKDIILTLYNSLVRPLLEYCVQFWCPYYQKDIDKLERVQRRVTKMIPNLRNKPYEDRLKELDLFPLTQRRLRGDLIQTFKIIKGIDNVNCNKYFTIDRSNYTRGNGCKIIGKAFNSHESKNFFFNRVVNLWNGLPREVIDCNTVDSFKRRLDKHFATNPRLTAFVNE